MILDVCDSNDTVAWYDMFCSMFCFAIIFDHKKPDSESNLRSIVSIGLSLRLMNIKGLPRDLLVFSLSGLHLQTPLVHLVDIASALHVLENIILKFIHGSKREWHILVLLDIANDFGRLCPLGEIDQIRLLDDGWYTVLDEGQIGQIYTWMPLLVTFLGVARTVHVTYQKKGYKADWPCAACHDIPKSSSCYPLASSSLPTSP